MPAIVNHNKQARPGLLTSQSKMNCIDLAEIHFIYYLPVPTAFLYVNRLDLPISIWNLPQEVKQVFKVLVRFKLILRSRKCLG